MTQKVPTSIGSWVTQQKKKKVVQRRSAKPPPLTMPRHYYGFTADNGLFVQALRGFDPPTLSSGGARWSVIDAPRRVSFVQWQGRDPFQLDVPILLDGWINYDSIESECRKLTQMQLCPEFDEPPKIIISGALPISGDLPSGDRRWVIQSIDWGTNVYWAKTDSGRPFRLRQDAVIHFLEYNPERRVHVLATNTLPNTYKVLKGRTVTLKQVAKEVWGSSRRWKDIKKVNPSIRDPNHIKGPKTLRIP